MSRGRLRYNAPRWARPSSGGGGRRRSYRPTPPPVVTAKDEAAAQSQTLAALATALAETLVINHEGIPEVADAAAGDC